MILEQEIKLQVSSEQQIELAELTWLKQFKQVSSQQKRLVSTYYDTPELSLIKQGTGLRLRNDNGDWWQTVKCTGQVKNGLHQREEWEHPLSSELFDLERLKQTPVKSVIADAALWSTIQPVFTTDFNRLEVLFELANNTLVELAYDVGRVYTAQAEEGIHEIELELKQGSIDELKQFAELFVQNVAVDYHDESKAHRGYRLVRKAM
ncbi:hypothetical protein A9Q78_09055 [Methylophaga sp. 41_12_T18]|nr:hypothetical protein A9Q78_09055 [Methylophaga sp. 41_12_T18]